MKTPTAIACFSCVLGCTCLIALLSPATAAQPALEWIQQFGTSENEGSRGVSADDLGNVYVTGSTVGNLGGANAGSSDAFISKYDASGSLLWAKQLGTSRSDRGFSVSPDGLGNVYISGEAEGSFDGEGSSGRGSAFVSKYDVRGNLLWTEQFGYLIAWGVSADRLGNVFFSGNTRYSGSRGGWNAFFGKLDASGSLLWTEELGTIRADNSAGVSADGLGSVYITGWTEGSLAGPHFGHYDAFVRKYDTDGNLLWSEQLGSRAGDFGYDVSADGLGNVYITGFTGGNLGGANAGKRDAFVSKYDASGNLLWTEQLGTSNFDESNGVSADGLGNVYISGSGVVS